MAQIIEDEDESKVDNSIIFAKKTLNRRFRKSFRCSNRSFTDKYWCLLFLFIFTIWYKSCQYANSLRTPESQFDFVNSTINNVSEIAPPYYLWGRNWLFDTLTCNVAFLSTHYENNGSIVIWANILFCIILIKYSISSMPNNKMFHGQLEIACPIFVLFTLLNHLLTVGSKSKMELKHENLGLWLLPEAIFIMVWYTKATHKDDFLEPYYNERRYFREFALPLIQYIMVQLSLYLELRGYTTDVVYELGWDCPLSYVIVIGSCYVGLTAYYFYLIVISCTIDMDLEIDCLAEERFVYTKFFHALVIVGWYHFGTACYHAALIFPRFETYRVMNETEFKKEENYSKLWDRFYAAQFKLHNLTLMSTAVGGTSHAESLRELLRHYACDDSTPRLKYYQGFSRIARSLTTLLFATNSLLLILLWIYSGLDDRRLSLATWWFYFRLTLEFYSFMKILDMVFDTTLLHLEYAPFTHRDLFSNVHDEDAESFDQWWDGPDLTYSELFRDIWYLVTKRFKSNAVTE